MGMFDDYYAEAERSSRVVLVGEDNPHGDDQKMALFPYPPQSAGARLCEVILEMRKGEYLRRFKRRNLCRGKWSAQEAGESAAALLDQARRDDLALVLLGAKVLAASGWDWKREEVVGQSLVFRPLYLDPAGALLAIPHPSGRCRRWNDPRVALAAREAILSIERDHPRVQK